VISIWLLPSRQATDFAKFPADRGGVYFVRGPLGRVLYVGITTQSFRQRWANHHRLGQAIAAGAVVHFWALDCSESRLRALERRAIARYKPPWNDSPIPPTLPLWVWHLWGLAQLLPILLILGGAIAWGVIQYQEQNHPKRHETLRF
jgi:hypothetical protein